MAAMAQNRRRHASSCPSLVECIVQRFLTAHHAQLPQPGYQAEPSANAVDSTDEDKQRPHRRLTKFCPAVARRNGLRSTALGWASETLAPGVVAAAIGWTIV